jgi:hypothetical protein
VFWINSGDETISWARLDGSAGGVVDTEGFEVDAYRLSLDPVTKRLYWFDEGVENVVSVSTTGGAVVPLNTVGATPGGESSGIAVEPSLGKVFWINESEKAVSWASLAGTGGGDVLTDEPAMDGSYGLAVDAVAGRAYWANYSAGEDRTNALGFVNLGGGYAPINVLTAPVNGPQDPLLLKSPQGTGAPVVSGAGAVPATLSCTEGDWGADHAGSFLYQAPRSYAYKWTINGSAIPGATATTLTATQAGDYACTVRATNQTGSASQTSASVRVAPAPTPVTPATPVAPASLTATLKTKKPQAKAGKVALVKVRLANEGGAASAPVSLCAKLSKKAKKGLKTPKCVPVASVPAGGSVVVKLKVKTKKSAKGVYKFTVQVKGAAVKSITAKVHVVQAKHKKHKQQK